MRGKVAKQLRTVTNNGSANTYSQTNFREHKIPTPELNPDGTRKFVILETCTIVLSSGSRKRYKQAKARYKALQGA